MNKMADVAKLLGVELGDEFIAKYPIGEPLGTLRCRICDGDVWISTTGEGWFRNNYVLRDLLVGKLTIHKLPWKAKSNEIYFTPLITSAHKYTEQRVAADINDILYIDIDDTLYNRGLMCKTSEQAEELSQLLIKTARKFQGFDEEQEYE